MVAVAADSEGLVVETELGDWVEVGGCQKVRLAVVVGYCQRGYLG